MFVEILVFPFGVVWFVFIFCYIKNKTHLLHLSLRLPLIPWQNVPTTWRLSSDGNLFIPSSRTTEEPDRSQWAASLPTRQSPLWAVRRGPLLCRPGARDWREHPHPPVSSRPGWPCQLGRAGWARYMVLLGDGGPRHLFEGGGTAGGCPSPSLGCYSRTSSDRTGHLQILCFILWASRAETQRGGYSADVGEASGGRSRFTQGGVVCSQGSWGSSIRSQSFPVPVPGADRVRSRARSVPGADRVRSRARSVPGAHAVRSRARSGPGAHAVRSVPGAHRVRSGPGAHAFRSGPGAHSGLGTHRARSRASPTLAPVCAYYSRPSSASWAWPAILVYLCSTSLLNPVFFCVCVCVGNVWKPFLRRGVLSWVRVLQLSHSLQEVAILLSSRTHYLDSIHLSLIIKPSAEPYDHRLHVLLTHHFAHLFTHLPDCLFPHLSSLCLLSGVGTSHNISLKSAWNPALLAPWIFPVYVCRAFGFPLRGGLICVYFLLY